MLSPRPHVVVELGTHWENTRGDYTQDHHEPWAVAWAPRSLMAAPSCASPCEKTCFDVRSPLFGVQWLDFCKCTSEDPG